MIRQLTHAWTFSVSTWLPSNTFSKNDARDQIQPMYHQWWYFVKLQAHQAACWSCPVVAPFCTANSPACPEQSPAGELWARESYITTTTNVRAMTDFCTWIIQQEPLWNVNSSILPGIELSLNSSCLCSHLCNHSVKFSLADTLLFSCVGYVNEVL